jgi:hypothetical protein
MWAVVAVIGVGLPAAAWRLGRNPRPRPLGVPGPHADPIDRWLFDRYRLGELDRSQVRQAVFVQGRKPGQPALTEAVRGLAAEIISGRLRTPRLRRWWSWLYVALGVLIFANGIAERLVSHSRRGNGIFGIAEGAAFIIAGVAASLWMPRQMRRKARQALDDSQDSALSA